MAKEVAARNQQQLKIVTPPDRNWAEEYGSEAFQTTIVGQLLKFNKGEWLAGQEENEIALGSRFVAAMHLLQSGWMRWEDSAPVEIIMGLRADGFRPPPRETLGYTDKALWGELNGQQIDPWRRTDVLLMADPQNGQVYTYSPMSEGGLGAVKKLSAEYGASMRKHPSLIPIIELGSEWYKHEKFGKVYKPVLTVVDWRNIDDVSFEPIDEEEDAKKPAKTQKSAPRTRR